MINKVISYKEHLGKTSTKVFPSREYINNWDFLFDHSLSEIRKPKEFFLTTKIYINGKKYTLRMRNPK